MMNRLLLFLFFASHFAFAGEDLSYGRQILNKRSLTHFFLTQIESAAQQAHKRDESFYRKIISYSDDDMLMVTQSFRMALSLYMIDESDAYESKAAAWVLSGFSKYFSLDEQNALTHAAIDPELYMDRRAAVTYVLTKLNFGAGWKWALDRFSWKLLDHDYGDDFEAYDSYREHLIVILRNGSYVPTTAVQEVLAQLVETYSKDCKDSKFKAYFLFTHKENLDEELGSAQKDEGGRMACSYIWNTSKITENICVMQKASLDEKLVETLVKVNKEDEFGTKETMQVLKKNCPDSVNTTHPPPPTKTNGLKKSFSKKVIKNSVKPPMS